MLFDVLDQIPQPFTGMVASALIMAITKGPLNRISTWTVGGQVGGGKARMALQPLGDFCGLMNLGIIRHDREVGKVRGWVGAVESRQQIQEEPRCFLIPHAVRKGPPDD